MRSSGTSCGKQLRLFQWQSCTGKVLPHLLHPQKRSKAPMGREPLWPKHRGCAGLASVQADTAAALNHPKPLSSGLNCLLAWHCQFKQVNGTLLRSIISFLCLLVFSQSFQEFLLVRLLLRCCKTSPHLTRCLRAEETKQKDNQ